MAKRKFGSFDAQVFKIEGGKKGSKPIESMACHGMPHMLQHVVAW